MLRRIAKLLLVFMLLWLPLQGQAMVTWHGAQDQAESLAADDSHHNCHQAGASDTPSQNTAGDCHDGNCCFLCHAALTGIDVDNHPLAVSTFRPLPDLRSPSIFFEQPQRPPLV